MTFSMTLIHKSHLKCSTVQKDNTFSIVILFLLQTMAQQNNFSWCSTGSTALTRCVKRRSLRTSDRDDHSMTSYCHLILDRHPHCPTSCKIFCQTSSVLTCRNCTVCQAMFMMQYGGYFITDNICNNLITNLS